MCVTELCSCLYGCFFSFLWLASLSPSSHDVPLFFQIQDHRGSMIPALLVDSKPSAVTVLPIQDLSPHQPRTGSICSRGKTKPIIEIGVGLSCNSSLAGSNKLVNCHGAKHIFRYNLSPPELTSGNIAQSIFKLPSYKYQKTVAKCGQSLSLLPLKRTLT